VDQRGVERAAAHLVTSNHAMLGGGKRPLLPSSQDGPTVALF
jgi:hypothetical protein